MDQTCPSCPDGHEDPRGKNWGAWTPVQMGDKRPTDINVSKVDGSHISSGDAEWVRNMLRNDPTVLLDELKLLGGEGPLGEYLPGLVSVLDALGEQIAEAQEQRDKDLLEAAKAETEKNITMRLFGSPKVGKSWASPPPPPGGSGSLTHVMHYAAEDVRITTEMMAKQIKARAENQMKRKWLK